MREPPLRVRLLGHPLVMAPVTGLGLFILYQWTQHSELALLGLMALAAVGVVGKASQHRQEFVRWRRAWNSMADGDPGSPRGPLLGKLAIAIIVPAGFVAVESGALEDTDRLVAWALLATLVAGGWAMILRARRWLSSGRARSASRSEVVSICARSAMRVPSLGDAYKALPAHCRQVFNPGSD